MDDNIDEVMYNNKRKWLVGRERKVYKMGRVSCQSNKLKKKYCQGFQKIDKKKH